MNGKSMRRAMPTPPFGNGHEARVPSPQTTCPAGVVVVGPCHGDRQGINPPKRKPWDASVARGIVHQGVKPERRIRHGTAGLCTEGAMGPMSWKSKGPERLVVCEGIARTAWQGGTGWQS